jgi:hypothetical protein
MISNNYDETKFDLDSIQAKLADPETLKFVKEIAPNL